MLYDERYKGRIASWDDGPTNILIAAWVLGYENDTTLDEAQLDEVKKLLEKQRAVQRYYWSSRQDFDQALAGGEVVMGYSWNSTVVSMTKQGIPVKYANPKEGISTYCCGLVLCSDPPGPLDQSYDFIDAWIDPSAGKYLIEEYGYGHSNRKSFDLVAKERLVELGISTPEALFAQGRFDKTIPADYQTRYEELWQDVQAGM
jgi:spermidine/putrescine transport system substrate-binding protein